MLYPKPIIIAVCCAVAIVIGVYLVGRYHFSESIPDIAPSRQAVAKTPTQVAPLPDKAQSPSLAEVPTEPAPALLEAEHHPISEYPLGDDFPPTGYYYVETYAGQRILWPINQPYAEAYYGDEYDYGRFHLLTEEEHVRYILLNNIGNNKESVEKGMRTLGFSQAAFTTYPDDVIAKAKEWADPLYEKTYGPNLRIHAKASYNRESTEADDARLSYLITEKLRELEPRYLHSPTISDTVDRQVLTELFAAVGRDYQQYLDDKQAGYPKMDASTHE